MKITITRRALCAWIGISPIAATAAGSATKAEPIASDAVPMPKPDYIERTLGVVSADSGIPIETILSPLRDRAIVEARQKAIYLANSLSGAPVHQIGLRFGGRDHTTVVHAVRKMRARRDSDDAFRQDLIRLARLISPCGGLLVSWEHGLRKSCGAEPIPS